MSGQDLDAFSQSYSEARAKFLAAADAAKLEVHSHAHPLVGHDGEALAMDVALDGPKDARQLLLITSACHGVEGFCGSGVQIDLLRHTALRAAAHAAGVALLHVHALNPYGFSWWRRTTHENVDLNRNFHDFHAPLPPNPGYDEIAHLVVPTTWPPAPELQAAERAYLEQRGERAWQGAISRGQHDHPEGLFFGGQAPTWSNQTLRHVLRDHAGRCERLGWIDVHTGLGPIGVGERIYAGRDDAASVARARAWWGPQVTSIYDGSSSSAMLTGLMWMSAYQECPQAEITGIALEYGTLPIRQMIDTLRADQWAENHPELAGERRAQFRRAMRDAFYIDTPEWKTAILAQAREAVSQAITGLADVR